MALIDVAKSSQRKVKMSTLEEHLREWELAKQVRLCVHKVSHNPKKVATMRVVLVVFSAPN